MLVVFMSLLVRWILKELMAGISSDWSHLLHTWEISLALSAAKLADGAALYVSGP